MTLSDTERLSDILNDTKKRAELATCLRFSWCYVLGRRQLGQNRDGKSRRNWTKASRDRNEHSLLRFHTPWRQHHVHHRLG